MRRRGAARAGGRRCLARRRHRPVLDARLAEPRVDRARVRDGGRRRADRRRPARSRVLGEVVPGGLGVRDARADPPLVLLAVLHVGDSHGTFAVQVRADVREAARRARPRDAPVVGQLDRRGRGSPEHRRGRGQVHVLRAGAESEREVRLRAGRRDQAPAAHSLELGQVLRRLREHPRLPTGRRGSAEPPAARPLAARAHRSARRRDDGGVRALLDARADPVVRVVRRRSLELVHPSLTPALLGRGRGCVVDALARARPLGADHRARDAVSGGLPLAHVARRRRTRVGLSGALARGA